jgi:hypothetical protein
VTRRSRQCRARGSSQSMEMTNDNGDSFNSESLRRIGCALATGELEMPMGDPLQQLQEIILTRKPRRWGDTSELREIADRWKTCVGLVSAGPSKGGTQQEEGAIIHRS